MIKVRLDALEDGQAAILAEAVEIRCMLERRCGKQEADRREAKEAREADRALPMELKAEMAGFKSSLDSLSRLHREGMEVQSGEIAALEGRIGALEGRAGGLEGEVAALRAEFLEFREVVMPRAEPAGAAVAGPSK